MKDSLPQEDLDQGFRRCKLVDCNLCKNLCWNVLVKLSKYFSFCWNKLCYGDINKNSIKSRLLYRTRVQHHRCNILVNGRNNWLFRWNKLSDHDITESLSESRLVYRNIDEGFRRNRLRKPSSPFVFSRRILVKRSNNFVF